MIFIIFNPFSQVARVVWSAHDEHVGRSAPGAFPRSSFQPSVILKDCSFQRPVLNFAILAEPYWLESERMTGFSNWNWMLVSCLFFSCSFVFALAWGSWGCPCRWWRTTAWRATRSCTPAPRTSTSGPPASVRDLSQGLWSVFSTTEVIESCFENHGLMKFRSVPHLRASSASSSTTSGSSPC